MAINVGYAGQVMSIASSHFATAKEQFHFPLAYRNQRPPSATRTIAGYGAVVLTGNQRDGMARIVGITMERMMDMGAKDSMNVGVAVTSVAFHTTEQDLGDLQVNEAWYDKIIIGGPGETGRIILLKFMKSKGGDLSQLHMDYGMEMYDREQQDTHSGENGYGCSAVTLCSCILPKAQNGTQKRVLFVPTGVLLSSISFNEGQSILGITHTVVIEHIDGQGGNGTDYLKAFIVGGIICVLVQTLLEKTKMMSRQVMVTLVANGAILGAIGLYESFAKRVGVGATAPLLGFENTLQKGIKEGIGEDGLLGIFEGGLTVSSARICGALVFSYLVPLVFKPKVGW